MQNLNRQFQQLKAAIDLAVERHLVLPALILLFTTIDVCAWLEFEDAQVGVRFEKWCNGHLLPSSNIKATGADLYGARCGVLHTLSSETRKSQKGVVRQVIYGWGIADHTTLQKTTDGAGVLGYVAVQLEDLRTALFQAMDDLKARAISSSRIAKKAGKLLAYQSIEETEELYDLVKSTSPDA
jgi:hypothetical protein